MMTTSMYKPDKATTERNAKILRELVKQPDNKLCADCKRNDPRWASWNLGVYLCIRCSGIHRGMGTHISRVKSIDLDVWTPEQMESIQKWGNRRANLYWEAHLKAGHVPPDHKMESFIRSKYESRRWAMDGPPPLDPSVLEGPASNEDNSASSGATTAASLVDASSSRVAHAPTASLSIARPSSPSVHSPTAFRQSTAPSHSHSRQLLSAAVAGRVQVTSSQSQFQSQPQPSSQPPPSKAEDDLFSLDFHAPPVSTSTSVAPQTPKDVKQDILALFSAPTPSVQSANALGSLATVSAPSSAPVWGALGSQPSQQPQHQPVSMMGNAGTGFWGVSSGWNGTVPNPNPTHLWAPSGTSGMTTTTGTVSANGLNLINTADIWSGNNTSSAAAVTKKDDVFGDLWGDFK